MLTRGGGSSRKSCLAGVIIPLGSHAVKVLIDIGDVNDFVEFNRNYWGVLWLTVGCKVRHFFPDDQILMPS